MVVSNFVEKKIILAFLSVTPECASITFMEYMNGLWNTDGEQTDDASGAGWYACHKIGGIMRELGFDEEH